MTGGHELRLDDLIESHERDLGEIELTALEERVNVDRRWLGTLVPRVRPVVAGLGLLAVAALLITHSSRNQQPIANVGVPSLFQTASANPANKILLSRAVPGRNPKLTQSLLGGLPIIFEPNRGQTNLDPADPRVKFLAHGPGYNLFLGSEGATVSLLSKSAKSSGRIANLKMRIAGSSPNATIVATDPLPGKSNYLIGNVAAKWRTGIPQFARVRYDNIYPGVNVVFYGNRGRLEFDFQVAPYSDPALAELQFDGAESIRLSKGAIFIKQNGAEMRLDAPHIYQQIDGREQTIAGGFILRGAHRAGFAIGPYDRSRELIIDPVPTFSTYFGGSGDEHNSVVAVDSSGNIYLSGSTNSTNLPVTAGVLQSSLKGAINVYVAKINPNSSVPLEYVTYLGGSGTDVPAGIAVDGAGDAFIVGTTSSLTDFPVSPNAYQTTPESGSRGTQHVFVTELDPLAATLKYSSYLSGSNNDIASGMTIDTSGNIYITGSTFSTLASDVGTPTGHQFPSSSLPYAVPFQAAAFASPQFFVTKINPADVGVGSIAYSTYFGGAFTPAGATIVAQGGGIAVDQNETIYFDGTTNFAFNPGQVGSFPILNAYQPCLNQQPPAVVQNPPTCSNSSGNTDAFVAKLVPPPPSNPQGQQLQWSTYLGGSGNDLGNGIALDTGAANIYVVGTTGSTDIVIPTVTSPFQPCLDGPTAVAGSCPASPTATDAFAARFPNLTLTTTQTNLQLNYFSYLGGSGSEAGLAIAADNNNGALITGSTQSTDFPTFPTGEIQTVLTGTQDAFVARIDTIQPTGGSRTGSWATYFGGSPADTGSFTEGTGIAIDVNQNTYFAGDTNAGHLFVTVPVAGTGGTLAGGFDAFVTQLKSAAGVAITGVATLGPSQSFFSAGVPATFTYTITNQGPDLATGLTVTDNLSSSPVSLTFDSASATAGTCGGGSTNSSVSCTIGSLQAGSTATVTIVVTPTPNTNGTAQGFNGGTVQVLGQNNILLAETSVSAQMSDFGISVFPANQSVANAGASASYSVQITPHPVFGSNVSLACSNTPPGAQCNFSPSNSVPIAGSSAVAATLTITTTARPIVTTSTKHTLGPLYALWLFVPGVFVLGIAKGKKGRRGLLGAFLLTLLLLQLFPLPACSTTKQQPPPAGTPAGVYPITVTGAAGTDSKSQVVDLTVP